jgi:voltage-gated potassium channel
MRVTAALRGRVGGRVTVGLVALAALLSVGTGLVNIGSGVGGGVLQSYVRLPPFVTQATGFTGTLTGFLLLVSAFGLRKRLRSAWYAAAVLLPLTGLQGLLQEQLISVPLVVVSAAGFGAVLLNRPRFDRDVDLTATQLAAVAALAGSQLYGTVGAYALREEFSNVDSLVDAFYFTLVTGSTVGYGDVTPAAGANDDVARLFTVSVLLVSVSSFAVALGVLLTPAIEARLTRALGRMTESQLELLERHVLVLGYGELTEPIIEELRGAVPFVVITSDRDRVATLAERDIDVLAGDPSDEDVLHAANVETARAVVTATQNDAEDALAILTARQLNPDLIIVAAAAERENVEKLKRAGADVVISPAAIGGRLLAQSALGGRGTEAIAQALEREGQDADLDRVRDADDADDAHDAAGDGDPPADDRTTAADDAPDDTGDGPSGGAGDARAGSPEDAER